MIINQAWLPAPSVDNEGYMYAKDDIIRTI